ncbi:MAG: M23 family metallopeptidase [Candidatus Heimdallarchaeota archaeon]
MKRKTRIILLVLIPIILVVSGIGGFALWSFWPATFSTEPPVLDFPVENTDVIHVIAGYGNIGLGFFHNGIDFGCNDSVNIVASCDLRVIGIKTWLYATDPDRWQTGVQMRTNIGYTLEIAFESWALNESFGELQRNALDVKVGQKVQRGDVLGQLLYHGDGTHIHYMLRLNGEAVCPYQFFSASALAIFDPLWDSYGTAGAVCNDTST